MTWGLWGIGVRTGSLPPRTYVKEVDPFDWSDEADRGAALFHEDHPEPLSGMAWRSGGELAMIATPDEHQRKGYARELFNYVQQHIDPSLHHSDRLTDDGAAWRKSMEAGSPGPAHRTAMPTLYRGMGLSFSNDYDRERNEYEKFRDLWREHRRDPSSLQIGDALTEYLDGQHRWPGTSWGRHWTTDRDVAENFAHCNGGMCNTVATAEWDGQGEDETGFGRGGDHPHEQEVTLHPGAGLYLTNFELALDDGNWSSILRAPRHIKAHRTAAMQEIPQFGHQLPHVGPLPGADPNEGPVDNYWVSGGCGTLALAFKNMFPDLKIGAEITRKRSGYYDDGDDEDNKELAHVWVHDGTHAHDGFGTHVNAPDAWAGSHGGEIDLDVDPQKVADKFGLKWSPDDEGKWEDPMVNEAADVIEKHWFNRHYNPETGDYQDHPYKEARIMTAAVTVYTQPNCVQCTMTKRQLDKLGIEHDTVDVASNPDAHAYVTGLGYTAAPVVVVNNGEDHWAGFRPDRLRGLAP